MNKFSLMEIEDSILAIQKKSNVNYHCIKLEKILTKELDGMNFKINIVENNTNRFFGMNITPGDLDKVLIDILENGEVSLRKSWEKCRRWTIEIDSILLYDKKLNASPKEVTAALMHEIGHVIYSFTPINRANKVIKLALLDFDIKYRTVIKKEPFNQLMLLPIYEALTSKGYSSAKCNPEECAADDYVYKVGYASELERLISKLIVTQGSSNIIKTEKDKEQDTRVIVQWAIENVASLEFRRDKLRDSLAIQKSQTTSKVVLNIISNIKHRIFGKHSSENIKLEDVIREQTLITHMDNIILEKQMVINVTNPQQMEVIKNYLRNKPDNKNPLIGDTKSKAIGKIKDKSIDIKIPKAKLPKIEVRELDILNADIDNMEYSDDKIALLERVHTLLDNIDYRIDLIEMGYSDKCSQPKMILLSLKKQVEEIRIRIINTKIEDRQYGLFVKYPKGYSG